MSDNITLPREVVQEALEALIEARALLYDGRKQDKAATALRTAFSAEQPKPEPMTDCELLARLAVIEARLTEIQATLAVRYPPYPPLYGAGRRDCRCAWDVVCNNIACPRRVTVTFNTGGT